MQVLSQWISTTHRVPTLREWAYAGCTIDLIGATATHLFAGDPVGVAMVPAMFLVPLAVSYVLRPERYPVATVSIGRRSTVVA